MREMIFNDASVAVPANSVREIAPLLADVARGMAILVTAKRVLPALRMRRHLYDVQCAADGTLFDAVQACVAVRPSGMLLFSCFVYLKKYHLSLTFHQRLWIGFGVVNRLTPAPPTAKVSCFALI
jgi:hypothetical protein